MSLMPLSTWVIFLTLIMSILIFIQEMGQTGDLYIGTHWKLELSSTKQLKNGQSYMGHIQNPDHIYLDGRTIEGSTGLAPHTDQPYTGTQWKLESLSDGSYALKCLGHISNTNHIYLDGRTQDGSVGLAPSTDYPYTGTHWELESLDDGSYAIKCLGHISNSNHIYLDGPTEDGSIGLAPSTNHPYTGTHWKLELSSTKKPKSGQSYTLQCLGHIHNPDHVYLDGRTIEGSTGLAPHTDQPYTGTQWKLKSLSDGSYALKCLGHISNTNHIYLWIDWTCS